MAPVYKVGDHVQYHAVGTATAGTQTSITTGEIVDVLTETQPAGETGVSIKASEQEPRYLIKNDNTQKDTAYKRDNIIGRA
ncbi:hypothetical protein AX17_003768 [Amanita inopinata Kibby_2008]|nr:hypothetical protein AX17_003768 [Amanita inopinata Kibby_2008]